MMVETVFNGKHHVIYIGISECVLSYTGYHIPPQHYNVTQPSRKYKVSNLFFKAMSLLVL